MIWSWSLWAMTWMLSMKESAQQSCPPFSCLGLPECSEQCCLLYYSFFLSFVHLNSLRSNFTLIWVATLLQLEVFSEYPWIFYLHTQEPLLRMLHFHLRGLLKWSTANTHISIPKGQLVQIRVNYFPSSLSVGSFINCYLYVFWTHLFSQLELSRMFLSKHLGVCSNTQRPKDHKQQVENPFGALTLDLLGFTCSLIPSSTFLWERDKSDLESSVCHYDPRVLAFG